MRIVLFILLIGFLWIKSAVAYTVYCTNCSNEATSLLQKALQTSHLAELKKAYEEYIQQTVQQITMVQQNVEQYANMIKNTVQLPANLIREVAGELSKLGQITAAINTLRNDITGMANVFDELYRTPEELKKLANVPKEILAGSSATYGAYQENWAKRVDESTKATFQLTASQLKDLENSGKLESYINELLSTPDGQQKAIMAGNQLIALHLQEARQLRELVATKFQSDLASQTKAEKQSEYSRELRKAMSDFSNINLKPIDDKGF